MNEQRLTIDIPAVWNPCRRCKIGELAHRHVHFRKLGNLSVMDILFVGEGPGKSEDMLGEPFVGASGNVINSAVRDAMDTDDYTKGNFCVGFANIVACRPVDNRGGNNRQPSPEEAENCKAHLSDIVKSADPTAIVYLGRVAQTYGPKALEMAGYTGLVFHIPHPSFIQRRGGVGSADYDRYVVELKSIFDVVFETADEGIADEN